jgi:hypothetical protein
MILSTTHISFDIPDCVLRTDREVKVGDTLSKPDRQVSGIIRRRRGRGLFKGHFYCTLLPFGFLAEHSPCACCRPSCNMKAAALSIETVITQPWVT